MKKGRIENKIYRKKEIDKYQQKCLLLGANARVSAYSFLNMRLFSSMLLFILLVLIDYRSIVISFGLVVIYYSLFSRFYLDYRIELRRLQLEKEAISFFEVLNLSLESGRNLTDSLELSIRNVEGELSQEFSFALREVGYGKSLGEALENLKVRIPSSTIQNMILSLRQSHAFGNSMVHTLHGQIDYIREMRVMEVKEKINKMPIQVSVVSVVLFVPIIMLLVLSPVIVQFLLSS